MEALDIANAFFQECGAAQLSAVKFAGFEAQVLISQENASLRCDRARSSEEQSGLPRAHLSCISASTRSADTPPLPS
jgi:hypothetical protein